MNRHGLSRGLGQAMHYRIAQQQVERATAPRPCTRCGQPIRWLDRRPDGGRIPLDVIPAPRGRWEWRGDVTWTEPASNGSNAHERFNAHRCPPPRDAA